MIVLPTTSVLAVDDLSYTVLAPLPCIGSDQDCKNTATKTELKDYLPGMFKLAIGLSAVFAVQARASRWARMCHCAERRCAIG